MIKSSLLFILFTAVSFALDDYHTYAAEPFRRVHFGEMDNIFIDTFFVVSLTIKENYIQARVVGSDVPVIIRPPDRLERIYGR
jgi:hypothetical protein